LPVPYNNILKISPQLCKRKRRKCVPCLLEEIYIKMEKILALGQKLLDNDSGGKTR